MNLKLMQIPELCFSGVKNVCNIVRPTRQSLCLYGTLTTADNPGKCLLALPVIYNELDRSIAVS